MRAVWSDVLDGDQITQKPWPMLHILVPATPPSPWVRGGCMRRLTLTAIVWFELILFALLLGIVIGGRANRAAYLRVRTLADEYAAERDTALADLQRATDETDAQVACPPRVTCLN
jgi:hypothetical protein